MLSDVQLYCLTVHCFCSLSDTVFSANLAVHQHIFNTILAIFNLCACFSAKFSTFLSWRTLKKQVKHNPSYNMQKALFKVWYTYQSLACSSRDNNKKNRKNSEDSHLLYWIVTGKTLLPCDHTWRRKCHIMKQTFYFTYKDCPSKYLHYVVFMNDMIMLASTL